MRNQDPYPLLKEPFSLGKIPFDQWLHFEFNEGELYLGELLRELQDNLSDLYPEKENLSPTMHLKLSLKRRKENPYHDHLLVQAQLQAQYQVPCIRCLIKIEQNLNLSFKGVFLTQTFAQDPHYQRVLHLFFENEEYELYFYERGKVDLRNFVQEQIHMNTDPYPLHDPHCQGLCTVCGADLNQSPCAHGKPVKIEAL